MPVCIKKKHRKFIQAAIFEATKSSMRFKHGCVIVLQNSIIARGHNYNKQLFVRYSIHAEEDAINNLMQHNKAKMERRASMHLYVVRIRKDGIIANSAPCDVCSKRILKTLSITKVFYSSTTTENIV